MQAIMISDEIIILQLWYHVTTSPSALLFIVRIEIVPAAEVIVLNT